MTFFSPISRIVCSIALLFVITAADAQTIIAPANGGGTYIRENARNRKPVPYTPLREADAMWSKRIWRTIDLREKFNQPLYYPESRIADRKALFDVLKDGLLSGEILGFDNAAMSDEFLIPMSPSQVQAKMCRIEVREIENPNDPGTFIPDTVKICWEPKDVKQYWIKEEVFLDKQRGVMETRIIGLCPLVEKVSENGDVVGMMPLFWVYFPSCRNAFARTEVYNPKNDSERRTLDDVFQKRMFSSFIHRESNVYERWINSYAKETDALLEAERIKGEVANMEHDMFHF